MSHREEPWVAASEERPQLTIGPLHQFCGRASPSEDRPEAGVGKQPTADFDGRMNAITWNDV